MFGQEARYYCINFSHLGRDSRKFPLLGPGELGNYKCSNPHNYDILRALSHPYCTLTYVQHYTPCTKPLPQNLFKDHPFLLTYLLWLDFVKSNPKFAVSADAMWDYNAFKESTLKGTCKVRFCSLMRNIGLSSKHHCLKSYHWCR